jgi:hypothetical protein
MRKSLTSNPTPSIVRALLARALLAAALIFEEENSFASEGILLDEMTSEAPNVYCVTLRCCSIKLAYQWPLSLMMRRWVG